MTLPCDNRYSRLMFPFSRSPALFTGFLLLIVLFSIPLGGCRSAIRYQSELKQESRFLWTVPGRAQEKPETLIQELSEQSDPKSRNDLALAHLALGDPGMGESLLLDLVLGDAGFQEPYLNLSLLYTIYREKENSRKTLNAYVSASALADSDWLDGLNLLHQQQRIEEAITLSEILVRSGRSLPRAAIWRGDLELARNRPSTARVYYQEALQKEENSPEALTGIGYIHLISREWRLAVEYLERAHRVGWGDPALPGYIARAHLEMGDTRKALQWIQKSKLRDSETLELHGKILLSHDYRNNPLPLVLKLERTPPPPLKEEDGWVKVTGKVISPYFLQILRQISLMESWYGTIDLKGRDKILEELEKGY